MVNDVLRLVRGREWQFEVIIITALASALALSQALLLGWPLWGSALATLIPWAPLFGMKVFWDSRHYGFMAAFLVIMVLQLGHMAEHLAQMLQFISIYDPARGCVGWSWNGPGCPDAHGVFGALDREVVHFIWDGLVLVACVVVRLHFRQVRNPWLTLAVVAAAAHQVEHIYLFGIYLFDPALYRSGGAVLSQALYFCTIPDGAGVQAGLLGHDGLLGTLLGREGAVNALLPNRINLHFVYNSLVLTPMIFGFVIQTRYVYDEWLARALPGLSREQLIHATDRVEHACFPAGATIVQQGAIADKLYIISRGQAEVRRSEPACGETDTPVGRLGEGQFFGEIGLLARGRRTASVVALTDVECLTLDRVGFKALLEGSAEAHRDVDLILRRRIVQLGAAQGLALEEAVGAEAEQLLHTTMIRRRVALLEPMTVGAAAAAAFASKPVATLPLSARGEPQLRGALTVTRGTCEGMRFALRGGRLLLGRQGELGVGDAEVMQIVDARLSRRHAEIAIGADGAATIRDLGSTNGTWLDGQRIGELPVPLRDGASIRLGRACVIRYEG
jgi:CRP-like cAMP-binding protein